MNEAVLVTGGNRGLGLALACAFAEHKHLVVLHSRNPMPIDHLPKDCGFRLVTGDLRDSRVIYQLVKAVKEENVKILVNNAAVYDRCNIETLTHSKVQHLIEVNLMCPIMLTHAVWPSLKSGGMVININSFAGINGADGELVYCATKHGLAGFSKSLQFDGVRDDVRVLDVYLGAMRTRMTEGRNNQSLFMEPSDVAEQIVSLCANYASLRVTEITLARKVYF